MPTPKRQLSIPYSIDRQLKRWAKPSTLVVEALEGRDQTRVSELEELVDELEEE
jgi:hypothetical protein